MDVAVVTGAAQGIGQAIATRLLQRGGTVWCVDNDVDRLATTVRQLSSGPGFPIAHSCDVGDADAVAGLWRDIDTAGDMVTALVNNAGIFPRSTALATSVDEWNRVLAVNLTGGFLMARHLARRLIERDQRGSVVSVTSGQAYQPHDRAPAYAATKAALANLSRSLAYEWGPFGIRVNTVVPGLTDTAQSRATKRDEDYVAAAATVPMRRIGTPEDVAAAVAFLLSTDAAHITGHALAVNGGRLML
ncbi:MAG TPA: SDR family NAD(P)-dependent oxidoreductase [Pseudonocardiaceae bacterium]|nr:SDR family NAD(P)-dependent oxidoreductase [Pseudonocardiaceae bacterium]